MNESDRIIYHIQTKLQCEIPKELKHDIESGINDAMKKQRDWVETDKVKYFNELNHWAKRHQDKVLLSLIDTLKNGGSIR